MKAQWLLVFSLIVSSITQTKWVEIPGSEKIKKVSIGNKNTIWGIGKDDQFPYRYNGKQFILENKQNGQPLKIWTISIGPDSSVYASGYDPLHGNQNSHRGLYSYNGGSWNLRAEGFVEQNPIDKKQYVGGFMDSRNFGNNNLILSGAFGLFKINVPTEKTKIIEKSELVVSYEDVNPQEVANIGTTHEITADNQPDLKSISLESIALDGTILATKADAKTTTILQWDGKNWKPLKTYSLDKPFPTFPLFVINKNDIRAAFYDPATKKDKRHI